jgi:hypothetical protein
VVAQVPLGLLISQLPTVELPLGRLLGHLQVALFLFFDRK